MSAGRSENENEHQLDGQGNMSGEPCGHQRSSAPPSYQSCHDNIVLLRTELKITSDERDALMHEVERLQKNYSSLPDYESRCSSLANKLEHLQHQYTELLQNYNKEKNTTDKMTQEMSEMNAREQHLRRQNVHLQQMHLASADSITGHLGDRDVTGRDTSSPEISEMARMLRMQNRELSEEVFQQKRHYASLQQRLTDVTQKANYDRTVLQDKLSGAAVEKSRLELQLSMITSARSQDQRDLARIRSERNAAVLEYQTVMSERDSVLREMEQLRSTVAELETKLKAVEEEHKAAVEEAEQARSEAEAIAHCSSAIVDTTYVKEIERLSKEFERMKSDLADTLQELESSKQRCNWAFGERDKIVRECDSIRTLCDQLRRERDSATSELISALRDSDEMKRQKNEAFRELKELRERYDMLLEKEMGSGPDLNVDAVCHHHSRDSAIDTDLHELDMEMLEVELEHVDSPDLGFSLAAGSNDLNSSASNVIFVRNVQPSSSAYGKLKPNDQIVRVNGIDVNGSDVSDIFHMLHSSHGSLRLTLRRRRLNEFRIALPLHVSLSKDHQGLGIVVEQGQYISEILPGSAASQSDSLVIGDHILSVNGISVTGKSVAEVHRMLETCGDHVALDILRYQTTRTPASSITGSASTFRTPTSPIFLPIVPELPSPLAVGKANEFRLPPAALGISKADDVGGPRRESMPTVENSSRKSNFLDRAVNVIKRPFSKLNRANRDSRCKSANFFTASAMPVAFETGSNEKIVAAVSSSVDRYESPSIQRPEGRSTTAQDNSGHGTWPKYRARAANRPTILPLDRMLPEQLTDDQSPLIPETWHRDSDIRRSESARHHQSQVSDSAVDYVNVAGVRLMRREIMSQEPLPQHREENHAELPAKNFSEMYVDQCDSQILERNTPPVPSTTADRHLTVISHFPANHSIGGQTEGARYSPRPLPQSANVPSLVNYVPTTSYSRTKNVVVSSDLASLELPPRTMQSILSSATCAADCSQPSYETATATSGRTSSADLSICSSSLVFGQEAAGAHPVSSPSSAACPWSSMQRVPTANYPCVSPSDRLPAYTEATGYQRSNNNPSSGYAVDYPVSHDTKPFSSLQCNGAFTLIPQMTTSHPGRIKIPSGHCQTAMSPGFSQGHGNYLLSPWHSLPHKARQHKDRPRPHVGETRTVCVELNTSGKLGIDIDTSQSSGGIFVSWVDPFSMAASLGIMVGDQLLEVCGINMRNATKQHAYSVLRQLGGSVNMLLQYNPKKYYDSTPSAAAAVKSRTLPADDLVFGTRHGQPLSRIDASIEHAMNQFQSRVGMSSFDAPLQSENRVIECHKDHPNLPIGIELVGGNIAGIFVRHIVPGSIASGPGGLRIGDQIIEFNSVSFLNLTLEQAILHIRKPCTDIRFLARQNTLKYNKTLASLCGGDLIYLRAMREYPPDSSVEAQPGELTYKAGSILWVDNTAHAGRVGVWHAYLLDVYGNPTLAQGILPNRLSRVCDVQEATSGGGLSSDFNRMASDLRSSGSFRRSLFRRRRHRRSDSREEASTSSKLHTSHSDVSINSGSSSHTAEDGSVLSLEKVEKLDCSKLRPVIVIGPFADQLITKLTLESPDKYFRYDRDLVKSNDELSAKYRISTSHDNVDVGYVRTICRTRHCLINASPDVVEVMNGAHIFPIILFVKHKSSKQIKDMKDAQFLPEKMSSKAAKDLFERYQDIEQSYQKIFSAVIPGGNLAEMSCRIKLAIDTEQKKIVWVPAATQSIP